jgi:DNA-binding Lrp family transcriptional regulator
VSEKLKTLSFCLLEMEETGDIEEVYQTVRSMAGVINCDPVRTRYHIVAKIEAESPAIAEAAFYEKFEHDPGVRRMDFITPDLSKSFFSAQAMDEGKDKFVSSFILFEAAEDGLPGLISHIQKIPFVTALYPTIGKYDLLVEMKAPSFIDIHRTLTGDIRPLSGIQRCWMMDVINVNQL